MFFSLIFHWHFSLLLHFSGYMVKISTYGLCKMLMGLINLKDPSAKHVCKTLSYV